jgi:hypothetical protein
MFFSWDTCLRSYTPFYTISSLSTFLSLHIVKKNVGCMLKSTELSIQSSIVNLDENNFCIELFLIGDNTGRRSYVSLWNLVGIKNALHIYVQNPFFLYFFWRKQRIFKTVRPQKFFIHLWSHFSHRRRYLRSDFLNWTWSEHERNATLSFI